MQRLSGLAVGFLVLAAVFGVLERCRPAIRGQRVLRRGVTTDAVYWLATPMLTRSAARLAVAAAAVALAAAAGTHLDGDAVRRFYAARQAASLVARWPVALQALALLGVGDGVGYWGHRAFHRGWLWRSHAVHHGSTELDWLSAVRVHPLNEIGMRLLQALPFLLLGFDPRVVAGFVPLLTFYAIFVHANVPWDFGPLRFVIATPRFHRWHHTARGEGLDTNFAGLLPLWDLLFGTFYMPRGRQPERFGVVPGDPATGAGPVPEGFLAQLAYPFHASARPASRSR
jgi:sterol desaturase/sphingolipid hydroxylase (fatty acid hydroxylase superfamily)